MSDNTEYSGPYRLQNVELGTDDESDGWYVEERFEWQVIDTRSETIVLRIPYKHVKDNTEWPERDYWNGPQRVEIVGNEVRAYLNVSDRTGVRFEGQADQPAGYDVYPLPKLPEA